MNKIILLLVKIIIPIIFTSLLGCTNSDASVYICKGKYSKRYHYNKSCRGLANCSIETYKVSLPIAKGLRRTVCGWED